MYFQVMLFATGFFMLDEYHRTGGIDRFCSNSFFAVSQLCEFIVFFFYGVNVNNTYCSLQSRVIKEMTMSPTIWQKKDYMSFYKKGFFELEGLSQCEFVSGLFIYP